MNNLTNNQSSFGYHGEVTIKLKRGKYIYTLPCTHNQGLPYLFKSLCNLFAGKINSEELVPAYVALYSFKEGTINAKDWADLQEYMVAASALSPIYEKGVIAEEKETIFKTVLQGRIQAGNILSNRVYAIALFPSTASSSTDFDKALALYRFTDDGGNVAPIFIESTSLDDSFIFEWRMDFSNK